MKKTGGDLLCESSAYQWHQEMCFISNWYAKSNSIDLIISMTESDTFSVDDNVFLLEIKVLFCSGQNNIYEFER